MTLASLLPGDLARFRAGEVHVWLLRAGRIDATPVLTRQERLKATHFRVSADRLRYVASRTALRCLLAHYLGAPADRLEIRADAGRKPAVEGIEFNLAHSGAFVAIALAARMAVGIDVEEVRPLPHHRDLMRLICSPAERAHVNAQRDPFPELFRIWTRKEALLKGIGSGVAVPLDRYDVLRSPPDTAPEWQLLDLDVPEGYRAALAVRGEGPLRLFSIVE